MTDQWLDAFLAPVLPDVFHSVEHSQDIWREDPFDVPEIHAEARATFEHLVELVSASSLDSGRILLLRGEAGAGKTHVLRAFRNHVHSENRAFFGYMQMTSSTNAYDRYVLQKLIESLDQPYCWPVMPATSLRMLSNAMTALLPKARIDALEAADSPAATRDIINELTDRLADRLDCPGLDLDVVRAILFLQIDRPSVNIRVIKYLRSEALSDYDRSVLGDMAPRRVDDDPMRLVQQLAAIIRKVLNRSLVICLDQMEDIFNLDAAQERFARVMDAVKQIGEMPGTVAVLSCLDAFYEKLRGSITQSVLARVESDPAPIILSGQRSLPEIRRIVGQRLTYLYGASDIPPAESTTYPIPDAIIGDLRGTTRDVLRTCLRYRESAQQLGRLPDSLAEVSSMPPSEKSVSPPADTTDLKQIWNDLSIADHELPEEEEAIAQLLRRAIASCGEELRSPAAFLVREVDDTSLFRVEHAKVQGQVRDLLVAICDKSARGGGLKNQLDRVYQESENFTPVVVRSAAFPASPTAQANRVFGRLVAKRGARRVVLESADLRHMVALEGFRGTHGKLPNFAAFLEETRPLCSLPAIRELLALDEIELKRNVTIAPYPPEPAPAPPISASLRVPPPVQAPATGTGLAAFRRVDGPILLGQTLSRSRKDVTLEVEDLKRHITFIGGTGSGKTTAALLILEDLLSRGVSVVLVDRKGDLCGYADPKVWDESLGDPERDTFRSGLRELVDVALFTPGNSRGRGLEVPVLPPGVSDLDPVDRDQVARVSTTALSDILKYGKGQRDQGKKAVLRSALGLLGSTETKSVSVETLVRFLQERDEELMAELGRLSQFLDNVTLDLEILAKNQGPLLGVGCEPLDAATLLGRDLPTSKCRLSIVSTKFLGSLSDVQFWVAQLMLELNRYFNKHPSNRLQAAVMLDEADIYLPATSQPATKAPVEDLLRRARSMGVSVFLATQSPGDLDYRCRDNIRTWLVGLLTQKTAIEKLKDMFSEARADTSGLASQSVGQFHLLAEGRVSRVELRRNAVRLPTQVPEEEILELAAELREGRRPR